MPLTKRAGSNNARTKKNAPVNFAEGAESSVRFLSFGGSPVLEIHRRSRRGQRAAATRENQKREIQRRCQLPANRYVSLPVYDESNREKPTRLCRKGHRACTSRVATRSYIGATDGIAVPVIFEAAVGSEAENQIHNVPWLNPFRKITALGIALRFSGVSMVPGQDDICSQACASLFSSATVRTNIARAALKRNVCPSWGCGRLRSDSQRPQFFLCRTFANVGPPRATRKTLMSGLDRAFVPRVAVVGFSDAFAHLRNRLHVDSTSSLPKRVMYEI